MNIATVYVLGLSHATLHDAEFAPTTSLPFEMIDFASCLLKTRLAEGIRAFADASSAVERQQ